MNPTKSNPDRPFPAPTPIDPAQWKPHEQPLLEKFLNLHRVANCVVTQPGEMQGWFGESLWRTDVYAPFNARTLENYYSLAFFAGYDTPWNIYYRDPEILRRLELVLGYVYRLMRHDGALPEYATSATDWPMLASSSFGAMYMAYALEVAGKIMPAPARQALAQHCRRTALFALTDEVCYRHAKSFSNQILGAMAAVAKLARLENDPELLKALDKPASALLGDFMSPPEMGFLYEQDGAETFAYFFTTLMCLIALYHEWPDDRVVEVVRRHGSWMSRWMLPDPDGKTVLVSAAHETRSAGGYRLHHRSFAGLGGLMTHRLNGRTGLQDERRFLTHFLKTREQVDVEQEVWNREAAQVAASTLAYQPVDVLLRHEPYAPAQSDVNQARSMLPCLNKDPKVDVLSDARGNQFVFARQPAFSVGFTFQNHPTQAHEGVSHVWLDDGGTIILSANAGRGGWETLVGQTNTGRDNVLAEVRVLNGGDVDVVVEHAKVVKIAKTYAVRAGSIDVGFFAPWTEGRILSERIPLLLRDEDVIHVDLGQGPSPRVKFSSVTRTLTVRRCNKPVLRLELPTATHVSLTPTVDKDGFIRSTLGFSLGAVTYNRVGYRLRVGPTVY